MRRQKTRMPGVACALLVGLAALARAASAPSADAAAAGAAPPTITVFAAAPLSDAVGEIARVFGTRGAAPGAASPARVLVRTSFAASSVLARQIEAGAPDDVFISADSEWMDYLEQRHLLRAGTRQDLLGN